MGLILKIMEEIKALLIGIPPALSQLLTAVFISAFISLMIADMFSKVNQLNKIQEIYLEIQKRNGYIELYLTDINNSLNAITQRSDIDYSSSMIDRQLLNSARIELIEISTLVTQYGLIVEKSDFDKKTKQDFKQYAKLNNPAESGLIWRLDYLGNRKQIKTSQMQKFISDYISRPQTSKAISDDFFNISNRAIQSLLTMNIVRFLLFSLSYLTMLLAISFSYKWLKIKYQSHFNKPSMPEEA